MLKIGLTGGIASGKSTVAAMLRARRCQVLEMDPIGHELLQPDAAAYPEVVREFGREILDPGGLINRTKLGAVVFADERKRERLNAILHPRILERVRDWFSDRQLNGADVAVVEAALIYEAGYNKQLDRTVVCWCLPEQQIARLERRGLTRDQAQARINAQMPINEKRNLADDVIDCSKSIEDTNRQTAELIDKLKRLAASGNIS
ncbi:MAG: dephospho-CoA kinase [Candidatus Acidiferrales bacterium]